MEKLRIRSNERISRMDLEFQRDEIELIDPKQRLIGIKGARGVGKTTLLLQHLKINHGLDERAIYLSMDDISFTDEQLSNVVEDFVRNGGVFLYLDEVHKYPSWAIEVKNLYDTYPNLKIVFTGSSMLKIHEANADLSRRAIIHHLQGLSFRQFLRLEHSISLQKCNLDDILQYPNEIISGLQPKVVIYPKFRKYLKHGYYPFYTEGVEWFTDRLQAIVRAVIESDFVSLKNIDPRNVRPILQLLNIISDSPPFKPNVSKISERLGIARNSMVQYLHYLEKADLISMLVSNNVGISALQKPDKLFLENTNLLFALAKSQPEPGTVRETFVLNQLKNTNHVHYPKSGDFLINDDLTIEVGGKNKSRKQIKGIERSFIAADDLDFAVGNKIPIWLFGLMY